MATSNTSSGISEKFRWAPYKLIPKCLDYRCQKNSVAQWKMELDDYFVKRIKFCCFVKDVLNCEKKEWTRKCGGLNFARHQCETNRLFRSCGSFTPEQCNIGTNQSFVSTTERNDSSNNSIIILALIGGFIVLILFGLCLYFCKNPHKISNIRAKTLKLIDKVDSAKFPSIFRRKRIEQKLEFDPKPGKRIEQKLEFDPKPGPSGVNIKPMSGPKKIPENMRKYLPISPEMREAEILDYIEKQRSPRQPDLNAYLLEEMMHFYQKNIHPSIYGSSLTIDENYIDYSPSDTQYYDTK